MATQVTELTPGDFARAAPVLLELRGHRGPRPALTAAAQQQAEAGYRVMIAEREARSATSRPPRRGRGIETAS